MNKNIGFTALLNDADIYSWNRLDKDTKSLILKSTFYHWQKRSRYKSLFISCLILVMLFLQLYTGKNPFVLTLFLFLFISNVCTIIKPVSYTHLDCAALIQADHCGNRPVLCGRTLERFLYCAAVYL